MKYYRLVAKSDASGEEGIFVSANISRLGFEERCRISNSLLIPTDSPEILDYYYIDSEEYPTQEIQQQVLDTERLDIYDSYFGGHMPKLVTAKVKAVLERFVICKPYKFYPAKLLFGDKKYDYFIFTILFQGVYSKIFPLSSYKLKEMRSQKMDHSQEYRFKDWKDYREKIKELSNKPVSKGEVNPLWRYQPIQTTHLSYSDIFLYSDCNLFFVVSERLKSALEAADIKYLGFELMEEEFEFLEGVPEDMQ